MAIKPLIEIGYNKTKNQQEAKKAGKDYGQGFSDGIEQSDAEETATFIIDKTVKNTKKEVKAEARGLMDRIIWGRKGRPDKQQAKRESEEAGKEFAVGVTGGAKRRAGDQAEQGLIGQLLWGKAGERGAKASIKQTTQAIATSITNNLLSQVGGLGGLNQNMSQYGAIGGTALSAANVGMDLLNRAVSYGREREQIQLATAPMMGDAMRGYRGGAQAVDRALSQGRRYGFKSGETAQMLQPLARQGAQAGLDAVLRGQRAFGVGGDVTELLGAQVSRGDRANEQKAMKTYGNIIGAAISSKLEAGRMGEVFRGMSQMLRSRGLGMAIDESVMARTMAQLGAKGEARGFRGAEAIEAMRGMEAMGMGGKTMVGRALALRTAGLGRAPGKMLGGVAGAGGDIYAAERQMELGFFGRTVGPQGQERRGTGAEGIKFLMDEMKRLFGVSGALGKRAASPEEEMKRGAALKEMSMNMGISLNATERVAALMEDSTINEEELKKAIEKGKSVEEQAFKAMINLGQFALTTAVFEEQMSKLFSALMPLIEDLLRFLRETLFPIIKDDIVPAVRDTVYWLKELAGVKDKPRAIIETIDPAARIRKMQEEGPQQLRELMGGEKGKAALARIATMEKRGMDLSPEMQTLKDLPQFYKEGGAFNVLGDIKGGGAAGQRIRQQYGSQLDKGEVAGLKEVANAFWRATEAMRRESGKKVINNILISPSLPAQADMYNEEAMQYGMTPASAATR